MAVMAGAVRGDDSGRIAACDADSYRIVAGNAASGVIVLCDHARNAFPVGYGTLGLPEAQLQRHIAYDIGAEAIAERIAAALDAPALLTKYSRLLIDPNRGADDPTLIMRLSDGAVVPGNKDVDGAERARRIRLYHRPYHAAIDAVIDQCLGVGAAPMILSVHSFTESWKGVPRPWHVGVLWDKDPRLAVPLLEGFRAAGAFLVGDNEPYKGCLIGDTMWQHGTERGLAHGIIEYRQDLVRDEAGQRRWADLTVEIVQRTLACETRGPALRRIERYGSLAERRREARRFVLSHARG